MLSFISKVLIITASFFKPRHAATNHQVLLRMTREIKREEERKRGGDMHEMYIY